MHGATNNRFWDHLDQLAANHRLAIDRPRGSRHPRWPDIEYPLDYGHLIGSVGGDGAAVDVWLGSLAEPHVTGVIVTVDLAKSDAEVKLLLGCASAEAATALAFHQHGQQAGYLIWRDAP